MAAIFKFVVFLGLLMLGEAILEYLPHLHETEDRQTLVEHYFNLGLQYSEIIAFLSSLHGIQLSLRQLKRMFTNRGLR